MDLKRLQEEDIRAMIAKKFGLVEGEIDDNFHRDVYTQSRGMPHFANEILHSARQRNSVGWQPDNRI